MKQNGENAKNFLITDFKYISEFGTWTFMEEYEKLVEQSKKDRNLIGKLLTPLLAEVAKGMFLSGMELINKQQLKENPVNVIIKLPTEDITSFYNPKATIGIRAKGILSPDLCSLFRNLITKISSLEQTIEGQTSEIVELENELVTLREMKK